MPKQNTVKVKESPVTQGACESIPYTLEFKGESGLTDPSLFIFNQSGTEVTCALTSASPTVTISTCNVTLPNISNLEPDKKYDVITMVMIGARRQAAAFRIDAFDEKDV
jgi:hypothetical protein